MKTYTKMSVCKSCGVPYEDHNGISVTCYALQIALKTLSQIAITPRNRGAKRNASATLHLLQTQFPNLKMP